MKLSNGEIFSAREPLQKLMEEKLPVKVSYGLAILANKLNNQLKVIEDVRNGLVKKYGKASENNPQDVSVEPNGANYSKFVAEFNELMAEEIEVVFTPVTLPAEVDGKPLELVATTLMALEKFVTVE